MIEYLGNTDLLQRELTAFLAPSRIVPESVLPTLDWASQMARGGAVVVSGFTSRLEQDVWDVWQRAAAPMVMVNARHGYTRVPQHLLALLDQGRLLIISLGLGTRLNRKNAIQRNAYVASLASMVVFPSIDQTSSLFQLYRELTDNHKNVKLLISQIKQQSF